jgi:hypothetical protein
MPRDIPSKKQKSALHTGKSYNDVNMAASAGTLNGEMQGTPLAPSGASILGILRSHSYGANNPYASLSRLALGAEYPHDAAAYELLMKCGHGATADVSSPPL